MNYRNITDVVLTSSKGKLTKNFPKDSTKTGWPWTEEVDPILYIKEETWPKITIVTPSFNQGKYIEETIRSVLLQNYPNLEYFVIDGGSTDNSVEIIKKYAQWITYWVSEPDRGQSNAINKGIEEGSGDIFNWINSDDWYVKGALKKVAEYFIKNKKTKVLCGREYLVHQSGEIYTSSGTSIKENLEDTAVAVHLDQPPTFFRFNSLKEIGLLSEDLHYMFDSEMWVRFILYNGIRHVKRTKEVFNYFRFHHESKSISKTLLFEVEKKIILFNLAGLTSIPKSVEKKLIGHIDDLKDKREFILQWDRKRILASHQKIRTAFLKQFFLICFAEGDFKSAKKILWELFFKSPLSFKFWLRKIFVLFSPIIPHSLNKRIYKNH